MSLQTNSEKLTASIALDASAIAKYLNNAIVLANRMSDSLSNADNDTLRDFLNSRGARLEDDLPERTTTRLEDDLTEHYATGVALNAAADSVTRRLGCVLPRVDLSSFADKLLATNRTATPTEAGWVIADIPVPAALPQK